MIYRYLMVYDIKPDVAHCHCVMHQHMWIFSGATWCNFRMVVMWMVWTSEAEARIRQVDF